MAGLHYQKGDIFTATTQVIVNTVNCEGFMGKGLALAFKQRYPDMFLTYKKECSAGKIRIGRPSLYKGSTPWILNFPTKDTWRANSKLEYLDKGLKYFVTNYKHAEITSIAFPKLGAQNGRLPWDEVGPLMAQYLSQVDIDVYIYIADGDQEYYYPDNKQEENSVVIWQHFNELALSLERLCTEIRLSPREAKKIFDYRTSKEFGSQSEVDAIVGLAKISSKRIKDYVNHQQYTEQKLPNIEEEKLSSKQKKIPTLRKQKKKRKKIETPERLLFPQQLYELISDTTHP